MDFYSLVRRAGLKDGMSVRAAARNFNKDCKTVAKMLRLELPPGYRRSEAPRRPRLDGYVGIIDEILRTDKAQIKKQRHMSKRIFERLKDEHGYAGSLTTVTYYMREQKRRTKEVFVPLSHRPGHVQVDFGETPGVIGGVECKIHFYVMVAIRSAIGPSDKGDAPLCCGVCEGVSDQDIGGVTAPSRDHASHDPAHCPTGASAGCCRQVAMDGAYDTRKCH